MYSDSNELTNEQIHNHFFHQNWQSILTWTTFRFNDVSKFRYKQGCTTALHLAFLFMATEEVIDAILYAAPELSYIRSEDGELPIHLAARMGAPIENYRKLLRFYPQGGITRNKEGMTALYMLWERSSMDFIEIFKSCVSKEINLHSDADPNDFFFLVGNVGHSIPKAKIPFLLDGNQRLINRKKKTWEIIMLMLKEFEYGVYHDDLSMQQRSKHGNGDQFYPLHCSVGSPVPLALTAFLYELNPKHLYQKDEKGRLPISIAAASPHLNNCPNIFIPLLWHLYHLHPDAISIQDWMGKSPLVLAIESGKSWDEIKFLLEKEPNALSNKDELSQMYPFMLASVKDDNSQKFDDIIQSNKLNLTFKLLRENPECIRVRLPYR